MAGKPLLNQDFFGKTHVKPQKSQVVKSLTGTIQTPGDKSISHRALMIGGLAVGETNIEGLLEGEDVLATATALRALGVFVEKKAAGTWRVRGLGVGGLQEPGSILEMGNSGTAARLLIGVLAGHPMSATLSGDVSLSGRPMGRVTEPLSLMGAHFQSRSGGRLPLSISGLADPQPIDYQLPVASAQVKSAILLAGLSAPGITSVVEPKPTRDHTERMLRHFGAQVDVEDLADGGRRVSVHGQPELVAHDIIVPGDISSAAFPMVAALTVPGSKISLPGVGINPLRAGVIETLKEMGGAVTYENERREGGEAVADLSVESSALQGISVPAGRAPSMIDEYPIVAVAAACAKGTTRLEGLSELRVKESDRLAGMARGLRACGVEVEEGDDFLVIDGTGAPPKGGAHIQTELDHRIAMSFLVLGMVTAEPVTIDDGDPIETSFPGFTTLMNGLGGKIEGDLNQ
ncbi:MAG: 3-phosphoshikimate 1-carboxyvinyltransferase [Rhodospirillaceae bacterium]|jgi:3-phosphoshikimate 1-carboxyvinyltransferase|nr:3-phosphoshikimate 1-carboxyvinyltransferase [Alphaproteobacteria bacterium]MBT4932125.1 3-phosphoshikimate 1-carboxyvinyltransferase [Rhodospirillaceae bacterium]MBT5244981.1 3-phosphoshikimate 1-carboxyvinyltransferase [Rhodospirillaceae bacterium]MBT5561187.1 3-phosphoshikimate 1-carboxyvinyltransferase [Rhodospirillaceae bacterium]MBT6243062.1 3-phosphoshikimate 1-carboxyvinyltransferase [Rhodospirillaceae bacterium]